MISPVACDVPRPGRVTARLTRRLSRGAAELFGVLVLAALAGAVLTAWTLAERERQVTAARETAGHVAAAWLQATHRSTMETDWSAAVAAGGALVTPASLVTAGHAPPGLPAAQRPLTMTLGVIGDGATPPVAMAFLVVTPDSVSASAALHRGLIDAGVIAVEYAAGPAGSMARHRPAIEALTGALDTAAFFVTADTLSHQAGAVYRRAQPGRPWLNRMESDLDLAGHAITAGAALFAGAIDPLDAAIDPLDPATWPGVTTSSTSVTSTAGVVADPADLLAGTTTLDPARAPWAPGVASLDAAAAARLGTLEAASIAASSGLSVTGDLLVGSLVTPAALISRAAAVTGGLQAASIQAAALTAQNTTVGGDATITGTLATTAATAGGTLIAPTIETATITATGGVYGPSLRITGRLTASACNGC